MKKLLLLISFGIVLLSVKAQDLEVYYDGTDNLGGEALKTALYNIIKGHTEYEYTSSSTDVWDILKETDKDPNNSANVILLYSGRSVNAAQEYNNANGWTREHVWAKSRGELIYEQPGPGTDVHNLRPCDNDVNTARNNRWFAECDEEFIDDGFATGSYLSSTEWLWKPRDEVKGDVARMIFYMATRYEGENGEPNLEVVDYIPTDNYTNEAIHAKLSDLLKWNAEDPVDEFERNRNNVIYSYQNNRNPFVDHPEWVECIWNDNCSGFWFSSTPTLEINDRQEYSYAISAQGSDKVLTLSGETIPEWMTFTAGVSETGNATASLTGSPEFSDIGTFNITIKLSDGESEIFQEFEIEVIDGNPIQFTSSPISKVEAEQLYSYEITATGDEGATFNISITSAPDWLSLSSATLPSTLSGTPELADVGKHSIVLSLTDDVTAKKTITQEFEIQVTDPNNLNTVIITQYFEGNTDESTTDGNDKYIEITNIGTEEVDLSNYYLGRWSTTSTPSGVYKNGGVLSGVIAAGETQVYKNPSAVAPAYAVSAAVASTEATFVNGDDPVALTLNGNTWDDRVDCLFSTGIWGAATSFYRKASVTEGNIAMSILDGTGEWIETSLSNVINASANTPEYLGYHGEASNGIKDVSSEFRVYPNPVADFLSIKTSHEINKIEIISLAGNIILVPSNLNEKSINVSNLEKGIYFLKITKLNGNIATLKFVKQ